MIYFACDFAVPDFGGFCWKADPRDVVPRFYSCVVAIEAGPSWEEIAGLHRSVHPERKDGPTLLASAYSVTFAEGKPAALGQLFLPGDFFRRPVIAKYPGVGAAPIGGARKYEPLDELEIGSNMDGEYFWGPPKRDSSRYEWYEPIDAAFAALTPELEGQIWCDWHRFPPRQQTVMQHWAAEVQARRCLKSTPPTS